MNSAATSEPGTEFGYMTLIVGLLDILSEINGVEVASDMIYMNFFRMGEQAGKKLGKDKNPHTALKEFIEYIKPCLDIEIINEHSREKEYISEVRFNKCLVKKVCKDQGLYIKNPLCGSTQGFVEGTLYFMTGKQVDLDITTVDWDICQGTVEFKEKRDIFNFI